MSEIQIFKTEKGTEIEVQFDNETLWLTQQQISELFQRDRTVIIKHINNIFKTEELEEKVVYAFFAHTTQHGAIKGKTKDKDVKYYNLDVILSIGYRINSKREKQFRQLLQKGEHYE